MRPLAKVLLRSGITYRGFADVAKRAFVHEAMLERDSKGRTTNISRIAVRTGLSRKDVRRVCEDFLVEADGISTSVDSSGPPARVLYAWHSDQRFTEPTGEPRDLPFEGESPNFADLVRAVGGDVPPGAVRAELFRASAILELENALLRPLKRYFVPGDFDEKAITILSGILFPLIAGVDHNSNPNRQLNSGYIQRFSYGKLDIAQRSEFRGWSRAEATKFIELIDDWLVLHGAEPACSESDDVISGIGVFFYEGPPADRLPMPKSEDK
jgi:hypothetical protein